MNYHIQTDENTLHIHFQGRLQFEDHKEFKKLIHETIPKMKQRQIVFNLSKMDFIDSSGIGMILLAHETAKEHDKTFHLASAQGQVKRVLELTRISDLIATYNKTP